MALVRVMISKNCIKGEKCFEMRGEVMVLYNYKYINWGGEEAFRKGLTHARTLNFTGVPTATEAENLKER